VTDLIFKVRDRPGICDDGQKVALDVSAAQEGDAGVASIWMSTDEDTCWMHITGDEARMLGRFLIALADAGDVLKTKNPGP